MSKLVGLQVVTSFLSAGSHLRRIRTCSSSPGIYTA